jgi:hypothetical protein
MELHTESSCCHCALPCLAALALPCEGDCSHLLKRLMSGDRIRCCTRTSIMPAQGLRTVGYEVCNMSRDERGRRDYWEACNDHILGAQLLIRRSRDMRRALRQPSVCLHKRNEVTAVNCAAYLLHSG